MSGRLYFFLCLSRMSLEGKMSNIGGHTFSMVMQEDFFMEFFLFDGGCL